MNITDNVSSAVSILGLDISTVQGVTDSLTLLFCIGGIIFLIFGLIKKNITFQNIGVVAIILYLVTVFISSAQTRDILTALASVVATIIALFSIRESKKIRKDGLDRENRDRKEIILNEIIGWAEGILSSGCSSDIDHTKLGEITDQQKEYAYIYDVVSKISDNYELNKRKSIYIQGIVSMFNKEVVEYTSILVEHINEFVVELDYIIGIAETEKESAYKLKYNNSEANIEIKRRLLKSKPKIDKLSENIELASKNLIDAATKLKIENGKF
jgi:hypothetical protein